MTIRLHSSAVMRRALATAIVLSLFWAATPVLAQSPVPETRAISVSGAAIRRVVPDQVEFRIAVDGRGATAEEALSRAGKKVAEALRALRSLTEPEQIQALDTQLREVVEGTNRTWVRDRGEPLEMLATRTLRVERMPMAQLGAAVAALAKGDLARLEQITPVVSAARSIENELQLEAADDARSRARALAERLGVELGLPLSVDVHDNHRPQPRTMAMADGMMLKAQAASVEAGYDNAGEQEIEARVRIRFELLPPRPR